MSANAQGPYFVADLYIGDLATPNFNALAADPRVVGVVLKATQGTTYRYDWFTTNWPRAKAPAGRSYGTDWFRGAYHFLSLEDGAAQADFFLDTMAAAGGFDGGDLPTIIDLEGNGWTPATITSVVSAFRDRLFALTGQTPVLYAGAALRDSGLTDHLGLSALWTTRANMTAAGWTRDQYMMVQYSGDGTIYEPSNTDPSYPTAIPGWGNTDMSVVLDHATGAPAMDLATVRQVLVGSSTGTGWFVAGVISASAWFAWRRWRRSTR